MECPMRRLTFAVLFFLSVLTAFPSAQAPSAVTAIRAGRLLDPEAGRVLTNQIILVTGNRITDVGPNVAIPAGAQVIDLSRMTVMPGLVDSPNHLALTYKPEPETNICVDCKPYGYTADEIRLFIREAAKAGMKVAGHVQTPAGAKNAIDAGIWSIEHGGALNDDLHKQMAAKGIWRAGTETPMGLEGHPVSAQAYQRTVAGLKNAYENHV